MGVLNWDTKYKKSRGRKRAAAKAAQAEASALARETLAFNRQVYDENKLRQAGIDEISGRVSAQQLEIGAENLSQSRDQWSRFKTLFAPVEERMVSDANTIDSAENQELAAGASGAQVEKSYAQAGQQQARTLASMGINPNSGRALAAGANIGMMKAADEANAMTGARQGVLDRGISMRAGVANFGRNMPNTAMSADSLALNAGNSAVNNSAAGFNAAIAGAGQRNQGFGMGMQGYGAAHGIMRDQQQASANEAAGWGQMFGTAAGLYAGSSKKIKEGKSKVNDSDTLDKVKGLPVEKWKYKDGEGDGGKHIGAYAEDVQAKFGNKAAPGGKMINLVSMHGIALSAIKGLAKQVSGLESQMSKMAARGIRRA